MRIVFIGCVKFSAAALVELLRIKKNRLEIAGVVTKQRSPFNSDFVDLSSFAKKNHIPFFYADKNASLKTNVWIKNLKPDVIYCFGWSHLLSKELLRIPRLGIIGFHPAALPANRGRHPIIWTLVLGLNKTASTFFFMDERADSGDILSQAAIKVSANDTAKTLYQKITRTALKQIKVFTNQLRDGTCKRIKQDPKLASSWRKRCETDGRIDWRMSAKSVYNLIRALSEPYPGAFFEHRGKKNVVRESVVQTTCERNAEPGKVLGVHGKTFTVKCGEGAIVVLRHDLHQIPEAGDYL